MAEQSCLVIIKPDGLLKSLTGNIISKLSETELKIIAAKIISVNKELAETHYAELKEKNPEIFEAVIDYIMGKHHTPRVLAMVYHGEDAINKIRKLVGETNPEKADPISIRGKYGRINNETGVMENCVHASDSEEAAKEEIKLWFKPHEIVKELYPVKTIQEQLEFLDWE